MPYFRSAVTALVLAIGMIPGSKAGAQEALSGQRATETSSSLPDAPSLAVQDSQVSSASGIGVPVASRYAKYIEPNQHAPHLTATDKVVFGVRDAFAPTSMLIWVLAAGYEQITDGSPNYARGGTIGFVERTGAAVLRDGSEGVFTDSIFAPIFHQDPRYYKAGQHRSVAFRVVYAVTRPLITRTDGGRSAPNLSLISGDVFGSWLTNAYYPQVNRGLNETAKTFAGSLASSALGDLFHEFLDDLIEFGHHKRQQP